MELTAFQKHKLDRLYKDSFKKLEDAVIKLEESKKLIQESTEFLYKRELLKAKEQANGNERQVF